MRRLSHVVLVSLVGWCGQSWASPWTFTDDDSAWGAEVSASGVGEVDRQAPASGSGPISHAGDATTSFTGTAFLQPLVNDPHRPLALLSFYQHPGELSLGVGSATTLSDPPGGWTEDTNGLVLSARLEGYPWRRTGLVAFATGELSGSNGYLLGTESSSYGVSLVHYFRANLRGELGYAGSVGRSTTQDGSPTLSPYSDTVSASNEGRARIMAVLLQDRLSVDVRLALGQFTSDFESVGQTNNLGPFYTHGASFNVAATVTGYFCRELSASITGGLAGQYPSTQLIETTVSPSQNSSIVTPSVALGVRYFISDPVDIQLGYQAAFPRDRSNQEPGGNLIDQVATASLVVRL
jgi:hypothetical protein